MSTRIDIQKQQPEAYKAMFGLEKYLSGTPIPPLHRELIKIRSSQINGCAFCIDMHTRDARKLGETEQRIYLLNAWREVDNLFTEEERCILAITEEVTLISKHGLTEETYAKAAQLFEPDYIAQLIMAVVTINAWNRIAISTHMQPAQA
nr:carboxymuconolactone decarboxylase family protein [uncultured Mucilaginibacter sp.]